MQPRVLGQFCLVRPLEAAAAVHQLYLARALEATTLETDTRATATSAIGTLATGTPATGMLETPTREGDKGGASHVIKLLPPREGELGRVQRARFLHERQLLHALNHPCIPSLQGHGEIDGVLFYASEYIDGVNLAQLLGHDRLEAAPNASASSSSNSTSDKGRSDKTIGRKLPKEVAVYVMAQLADALHHLHDFAFADENGKTRELGGVHRDVCPANVFLSKDGDVILGDYDAALSCWLAADVATYDAGHVAYKAPERLIGARQATTKSDLFALAVILWEMLKGERCFAGDNEIVTLDAIVRFDINHSSRKVPGLSAKLSEVLRRNLDRDPQRRFDDAYQVLQRLAQAPEAAHAERARTELGAMVARELATRQAQRPTAPL